MILVINDCMCRKSNQYSIFAFNDLFEFDWKLESALYCKEIKKIIK